MTISQNPLKPRNLNSSSMSSNSMNPPKATDSRSLKREKDRLRRMDLRRQEITFSIPLLRPKQSTPSRRIVFVDPEDTNAEFWWPAMVIPHEDYKTFQDAFNLSFTPPSESEALLAYFEDGSFSTVRTSELIDFNPNNFPYNEYVKTKSFRSDQGVTLATCYWQYGLLPATFPWIKNFQEDRESQEIEYLTARNRGPENLTEHFVKSKTAPGLKTSQKRRRDTSERRTSKKPRPLSSKKLQTPKSSRKNFTSKKHPKSNSSVPCKAADKLTLGPNLIPTPLPVCLCCHKSEASAFCVQCTNTKKASMICPRSRFNDLGVIQKVFAPSFLHLLGQTLDRAG